MLLIIAVLAFVSAAFLLFRYAKRQQPQISDNNRFLSEPPLGARPLFMPTDEELRRDAQDKSAREIAKREYSARAEAREQIYAALLAWRESRDRKTAAELLRIAAKNGRDGDLARAAEEILATYHSSGIDGVSANDMAALIDSHLALLSNEERSSGANFWLKKEVAKLRSGS